MEGAIDAMRSGEVDENWAREHHSAWVAELKGEPEPEPINAPIPRTPGGFVPSPEDDYLDYSSFIPRRVHVPTVSEATAH